MPSIDEQVLAELREIKRLLTPAPPAPPAAPKGLVQEFKTFLSQYKVLGLAVAFILGIYLGALVKALVTDLILPIISLVLPPGQDFNTYEVVGFRVGDFKRAPYVPNRRLRNLPHRESLQAIQDRITLPFLSRQVRRRSVAAGRVFSRD